ncbi:heterokaryon incompatibility protein-domain-containing protein [Camillea tinctor]|nr:heterokaryon incompatibility protein-domain-containing protein [Camillea tinctor]
MQLKALPTTNGKPEQYVALSYTWGEQRRGQMPYMTTRSNVILHIQKNGLSAVLEKLPKTVWDAMLLVKQLGERYLWVDSLCIVQDSVRSWELNAKAMHLVYGFAHFTICAADGDATTGLRAVDSVLSGRRMRPLPSSHTATKLNQMLREETRRQQYIQELTAPLTVECLPGLKLLVSKPPEAVIQDSVWNKRGWTFQERLLSRRCIIFAEGQVYFQCRSAVMSQDIFHDERSGGWSLDWTSSPLRTLGELRRKAFWFYMKCILLYTGRDLTHPKDVLTAFQGTSWLLQQRLNAPLFYGLPASHFDLALLWMPLKALERRKPKTEHRGRCSQDEFGNCTCHIPEGSYGSEEFPSWSWCGWSEGKAEYQLDMIDGCLVNVQEWLKQHTWILWYVRDYEGNLRPLWDRNILGEDFSEEVRWRGYSGKAPAPSKRDNIQFSPSQTSATYPGIQSQPPHGLRTCLLERAGEALKFQNTGTKTHNHSLSNRPQQKHDHKCGDLLYAMDNYHIYVDELGRRALPIPRTRATVYQEPRDSISKGSFDATIPTSLENEWYKTSNRSYMRPLPTKKATRYRPMLGEKHVIFTTFDKRGKGNSSDCDDYDDRGGRDVEEDGRNRHDDSDTCAAAVDYDEDPDFDIKSGENVSICSEPEMTSALLSSKKTNKSSCPRSVGEEDSYGRPKKRDLGDGTTFKGILPDNPFGIIRRPYLGDSKEPLRAMLILQFWTWRIDLYVTIRDQQGTPGPGEGLCHCDIVDRTGDWCGSIVLSRDWIADKEGEPQIFIAISDAKNFTADECPVWNYYIPKEKDESEWDLYHVLLLERHQDRRVFERVGLGKVFQAAFGEAVWFEIKMA